MPYNFRGKCGQEISTREKNNITVFECFDDPFTDDFLRRALNLPPIIIDDILHPQKRDRYTPDLIPAAISVASENYVYFEQPF